jgi:SAM-dependent methyltransferase/methyltransferase-like protein
MDFAYDKVLYPGYPFSQTHPGRLATLAALHGMEPAPPARCRMLELGCGDGGNLIPLAYQYPDSTFLGVDLSARAIEIGRNTIVKLGLRNIELRALDICEMTAASGAFDYIVAHGVYSWVPPPARTKILSIFRDNLARQGIAFVSYNCHPGSYLRDLARAIMLYHVRDTGEPQQRIQQGRMLLQVLAEISNENDVYGLVLRSQHERIRRMHGTVLHHDDLDAGATAFFLHQVLEDASRQGLQYLVDATAPIMTEQLLELQDEPESTKNLLKQIPVEDWATREQYFDFVNGRMFRETLLCHHEIELRRPVAVSRIRNFQLSAEMLPGSPDLDPQAPGPAEFKTRAGHRIRTDQRLAKAALLHLGAIWPQAVGLGDLVTAALDRLGTAAGPVRGHLDEEVESLAAMLFRGFCQGVVRLDAFPAHLVTTVSERPEASLLARKQLETGSFLTNLRHCTVVLDDPITKRLLTLLDGTRTIDRLVSDLTAALPELVRQDGERASIAADQPIISRENVLGNLQFLARLALLVA